MACCSRSLRRLLSWKEEGKRRCTEGHGWRSKRSGGGAVCVVDDRVYIAGAGKAKRRFECRCPEWVSRPPGLFNAGQADTRAANFNTVGIWPVAPFGRIAISRHERDTERANVAWVALLAAAPIECLAFGPAWCSGLSCQRSRPA